jgi:hypothetical protein
MRLEQGWYNTTPGATAPHAGRIAGVDSPPDAWYRRRSLDRLRPDSVYADEPVGETLPAETAA